jgi:hypothetical protein
MDSNEARLGAAVHKTKYLVEAVLFAFRHERCIFSASIFAESRADFHLAGEGTWGCLVLGSKE